MSQVAKSASAFARAFLAILVLELDDMVVRLFRPKLAGVHGDRWTVRLGSRLAPMAPSGRWTALLGGMSGETSYRGFISSPHYLRSKSHTHTTIFSSSNVPITFSSGRGLRAGRCLGNGEMPSQCRAVSHRRKGP